MAKDDSLIDGHLVKDHANIAIKAILDNAIKKQQVEENTSLLGATEQRISLSFTKKRLQKPKTIDPRVIPLAHPVIDPRTTQICLIVKDPQREYKDLLDKLNIKFIGRVLGITKLKGKWKGFEERRQLLRENGLFLVDDRVSAMMPKLLGKMWFKAKKQPLPVNMGAKDLKSHLERAINNTFMNENAGQTVTVRIGTSSNTQKQLLENITTALPKIISHIEGGWDNIQNVYLSVPGVGLPLWSCDLGNGPGGRWEGMTEEEPEAWGGFGGRGSDDDEDEDEAEPQQTTKGKKRLVDGGSDEEAPKKKSKTIVKGSESSTLARKSKAESAAFSSEDGRASKPATSPIVVDGRTNGIPGNVAKKKRLGGAATLEKKKLKVVESGGAGSTRSVKSKLLGKTSR